MKLLLLLLAACSGCAFNSAKLYDPTTGAVVAKSRTWTLFDSQSSLAKLHIDTLPATNKSGVWSPGISISGLNQEASGTNLDSLVGVVLSSAVAGAVKGAVLAREQPEQPQLIKGE